MKYSGFLQRQAAALPPRWRVFALLVKKKPLAWASNDLRKRIHAEERCLARAPQDVEGATLYVIRLKSNDGLALSKPCADCQQLIEKANLKQVYYSTDAGGWEKLLT